MGDFETNIALVTIMKRRLRQALLICFVCLILFFMSHQQSFSLTGTGLPAKQG